MAAVRYGFTKHGVMVQVHHSAPSDAEWQELLTTLRHRKNSLRDVVALVRGDIGPTSKQREALSKTLKELSPDLRFVMFSDSRLARGSLTALNWITGKSKSTLVLPHSERERGVDFLQLGAEARHEVLQLIAELDGVTSSVASR